MTLDAAAFFALRIVRAPSPGVFTCHGGGYVASGAAGASRLPQPVLPRGLALISLEGAGEVQTPITVSRAREGGALSIGDPDRSSEAPISMLPRVEGAACES